ncbi:hypothetical protein [Dipodfec virus UOA04_Rod_763]|nr:hypothetical protein [Dipodfec virus UOA04_Rod_763]
MKIHSVSLSQSRRFGLAHPHYLNNAVGYRGGIRF